MKRGNGQGSAINTGKTWRAAIQPERGTVRIPEVLRPYMGFKDHIG